MEEKKIETTKMVDIYNETFQTFTPGDIIKGRIIKKLGSSVLIDLGLKSEGILPIEEFINMDAAEEGKDVWVLLESLEDREGLPVISKRKADFQLAWETIREKSDKGDPVKAFGQKKVKGGLQVTVLGLDAFLPGSQVDIRPVANLDEYINREFDVKIIKVNWSKKNIVVSRRLLLEEHQAKLRLEILGKLNVGDLVDGTVKNLTDFGAFIDIGGIDALLHITDISWNKIVHPSEIVKVGDALKLKVLSLDRESGRVTVGLKQLMPHPWEVVEEKYPIGSKVKGRVTSIAEYGAFVELEKGIEGLIHVSEMSWTKTVRHPGQLLKVDQVVEAVVLNIDKENRRISLGLKQTEPDPWSLIDEKYAVGDRISGRVKSLKDFGAFVEIEEGIEGLVHTSDLSWTKRVRHPRELLKKNQKIEAVILAIDKENRRIALGSKQTKEDPFYRLHKEYKEGVTVKGKIIDLPASGVIVEITGYGIEGFVPLHQLARQGLKKAKDKYNLGEELDLIIKRIDPNARRVSLSEKAAARSDESAEKDDVEPTKETFPLEEHLKE
jgi:small subunit ribosomal protein S1